LNAAAQNGINPPEQAFTNVYFKSPPGQATPPKFYWQQGASWGVAVAGALRFDFNIAPNFEQDASGAAAVHKSVRSKRVPVTLKRFLVVLALLDSLQTLEQKTTLIKAISDTLLLKTCHVIKLVQACPKISDSTVRALLGHLLDADPLLLFDLAGKHKDVGRMFRRDARTAYFFNISNPTNRYQLNLSNPMEHSVATRLQVTAQFEAATAKLSKKPDISQHGNYECVRNVLWKGAKLDTRFFQWVVPDHGCLTLDYVGAPHCAPKRKSETATETFISDIVETLQGSMCSQEDKLMALRSISCQLVLTVAQVNSLSAIFPAPLVSTCSAEPTIRDRQFSRMKTTRMDALAGRPRERSSAFQFRFARCRVETFVCLFNRCVDPPLLCNSECLTDPSLFSPGCISEVCERLGRIRTFEVFDCSEPLSMSNTFSTSAAARMARTLQILKDAGQGEKSEAESGRRYELDLSIFEDWACASFLVNLWREEKGDLRKLKWSEFVGTIDEEDNISEFRVPTDGKESWLKKGLPRIGELHFTYVVEPESVSTSARRSLAEKFFGWEPA
jgi:hypothetical protein